MRKVSRRRFIHGVQAGGVTLAAGAIVGCKTTNPEGSSSFSATETSTFHFDLSKLPSGAVPEMNVGGKLIAVTAHTAQTRAQYRAQSPALGAIDDAHLTHFAENVPMAGDSAQSFTVTFAGGSDGRRGILLGGIHVPSAARAQAHAMLGPTFKRQNPRFQSQQRAANVANPPIASSNDSEDATQFTDTFDAAIFLVYHHPDVLALDPVTAALILDQHIEQLTSIEALADAIGSLGVAIPLDGDQFTSGWARAEFVLDPDGHKIPLMTNAGKLVAGQYEWTWKPDPSLSTYVDAAVRDALRGLRDDPTLLGRRFGINEARALVTDPEPFSDPVALRLATSRMAAARAATTDDTYQWGTDRSEWDSGALITAVSGGAKNISFDVYNSFSRYLTVYAAFTDAGGNIINLESSSRNSISERLWSTDHALFLGYISPPTYFFGVQIGSDPYESYTIESIQYNAAGVAVLAGSVRWGREHLPAEYGGVDTISVVLTSILSFGIPTIALAFGAYNNLKAVWKPIQDTITSTVIIGGLKFTNAVINDTAASWTSFGVYIATNVLQRVLAADAYFVAEWAGVVAAGEAQSSIPVLGWAMFAFQAANYAASVARTSYDMGNAKTVVRTTAYASSKLGFKFTPQSVLGFPATAVSYALYVTPKGGNTALVAQGAVPQGASSISFTSALFACGPFDYRFELLSATGWVAGVRNASSYNTLESTTQVQGQVTNSTYILTAQTRYTQQQKLQVGSDGKHSWLTTSVVPPGGAPLLSCGSGSNAVCAPGRITINTYSGQLAYGWKTASANLPICNQTGSGGTAAYTLQNLNRNVNVGNQAPDAALVAPSCGVGRPIIPLYCGDYGIGLGFILDPSKGVYHLRALSPLNSLQQPDSDPLNGPSWGQFNSTVIIAAALHKSGRVMAISGDANKLEVLEVPLTASANDGVAPRASFKGGSGSVLPGNVSNAVAVCAVDNADIFLVLENGNKRVQAFGCAGQPDIRFLGGSFGLKLAGNREYLDLGYDAANRAIFVLSKSPISSQTKDYAIDIFRLDGTTIVQQASFPAASLVLDGGQNIYAVNWETLKFKGVPQPGLSFWVPAI